MKKQRKNIRRNKRNGNINIKEIATDIVAKLIYYTIISMFSVACILFIFGTLGAIVELCTINKIYCISLLIVSVCVIVKQLIKELC